MILSLTILRPPSTNGLFANASGKGRRKTAAYKQWCRDAGWQIKAQRPPKVTGAYTIEIALMRWRAGRIDVANYEKAVSDLLVAVGVLEDDSLAESVLMTWSGSDPAMAEITIKWEGSLVPRGKAGCPV